MSLDYIIVFLLSFATVISVIVKVMKDDGNNTKGNNDDGGDHETIDVPPVIDLPPGIVWPDDVTSPEELVC